MSSEATELGSAASAGPAGSGSPEPTPDASGRWPAWSAPVALIVGLVLAAVGGIVVDLPAIAFGVKITTSHTPPGITIADTFVQDLGFVAAAVFCAQLGGRAVRSWQFGLRPPAAGWGAAARMIAILIGAFLALSIAWSAAFHPGEEKLLEQLGTKEGAALLILSATLTCIVAPICEEMLFRGYIFSALRSWRGTLPAAAITGLLFGGVHAGSAPALDLVPLAALGFGLCLLYRESGSLYPCFIAHALNNSIAFASLEGWSVAQAVLLLAAALAGIALLVATAKRVGLIARMPLLVGGDA